jgi:hypothetical protein
MTRTILFTVPLVAAAGLFALGANAQDTTPAAGPHEHRADRRDSPVDDRVQRRRGPHQRRGQARIGVVVPALIHRLAPIGHQFGRDLVFLLGQRLGDGREMGGKLGVLGLRGQRLGPVAGEPVVAVAVVGLAGLALGRVVVVEIALRGRLDRLAQDARLGVALRLGEELEALAEGAELAKAESQRRWFSACMPARVSGPSPLPRSRTARRPASASRSTASWPRSPVRGSGTGPSGSRAARCR